jgi:hypothetical protein
VTIGILFSTDDNGNNCTLSIGDSFVVWYDFNNSNTYFNNDYSSSDIYSLITWTGQLILVILWIQ